MRFPFIVLMVLTAGLRAAPEPPALLSEPEELAAYQREAAAAHPGLRAATLDADAAKAGASAASALPDPSLSLEWENDGWGPSLGRQEMSVVRLGVTQPLPVAGARALRRAGAEADARAVRAGSARTARSLRAAVAREYWLRAALRERLALLDEEGRTLALIESSARARYGAGLGSQTEILSAQAAMTALRERRAGLTAQDDAAGVRLAALLARGGGAPPPVTAALPEHFPAPGDADLAILIEGAPELAVSAAGQAGAQARAELARRERRPQYALTGGLGWRGALDPMWMAGVSVRLPRRSRSGGELSRARLEAESAGARTGALRLALRARAEALRARLRGENETVRLQREGSLPQRAQAVKAALTDYASGRIPFSLALNTSLEELAARDGWIETRRAAVFTLIDLEALDPAAGDAGVQPDPPMAGPVPAASSSVPGGM